MRRFLVSAVSAAGLFALSGTAAMAAAGFDCTVGGSGTYTLNATAGGSDHVVLTNEAGAKISVAASVGNPAESGSLFFSPGSTVLTFPTGTSAQISDAVSGVNLMLLANDGPVTVTLTCNPGAPAPAATPSEPSPATSTNMVREAAKVNFADIARRLSDEAHGGGWSEKSARHDIYHDALREFAITFMGRDPDFFDAILASEFRNSYTGILNVLAADAEEIYGRSDLTGPQKAALFGGKARIFESIERQFLQANPQFAGISPSVNMYAAVPAINSTAVNAINRAAGAADVVQGSFNVLGYGPTGGFSSSATLARGQNWLLEASAFGAISQTDASAGDTVSISGRGTINLVGSLAPNVTAGLSLGIGATSEDGPVVDDAASHYAVDAMLAYRLAPNLTMNGNLGYELTNHNYSNSTGKGSVLSHLYSAGWGMEGKVNMNDLTLTPTLGVEVVRENAAAVTLSDGTTLDGFDRTTGKFTIGGALSRDFLWDTQDSTVVVTPSLGADTSLSFTDKKTSAGVSSSSTLLGLGLTAGLAFELESGLDLSVSARVTHAGNTTGAGLTGSLSAGF
jgi:hypothetical protein